MNLEQFLVWWPELCVICPNPKMKIYLKEVLKRCRGDVVIGGFKSLMFDHVNEDFDPFILRVALEGRNSICLKWNDETKKWENLGYIFFIKEWGLIQFRLYWKTCFIKLSDEIISFKNDFECYGERNDGLLFLGKGKREGERMILRLKELESGQRLEKYLDPQELEKYDEENDRWELYGWLYKATS